ncbi:MAG: hypothetical protein EZS28_026284 [Streblomastix strix]|uniref:Uncharacterized protein n=1 Tax=Streblomastix strix TaxID=222440 RepID=A0A5J4V5U1_9EUKA|nr:MAG: hypothetical protein EZS28_026284 [Streblomastix strix]
MSFSTSDYLTGMAKMHHSDYISGYMAKSEVLKTMSIHAQSFTISKQEFYDQSLTQLNSAGVKYTRASLAARGSATCSKVQTCQVNWNIKLPANTLTIQLNRLPPAATDINCSVRAQAAANFNTDEDPAAVVGNMIQTAQHYVEGEVLRFWVGFSKAYGSFNQFAICKDSMKLWHTSIYARKQAEICSYSLNNLCTSNSVSVSPHESIVVGKRHSGVLIDISLSKINVKATCDTEPPIIVASLFYYLIPDDIIFIGVLDLNQLIPILIHFLF